MKKLVKAALAGIGLSAAAWALRERFVRIPPPPDVEHPPFRTGAIEAAAPTATPTPTASSDDLTNINGVGPVYARRLVESGIASFSEFFKTSSDVLTDVTGASNDKVEQWLSQSKELG